MDKIVVHGGQKLNGKVYIGGAKNAALPLMTASLLTEGPLTLANVPHLSDITSMANLLGHLGVSVAMTGDETMDGHKGRALTLTAKKIANSVAPYELVRKMRASILALGPLVARHGEAYISLPGGCAIGARGVDLHIKALEDLGANITIEDGYIHAKAPKGLKGATIVFPYVTVTGTENILMAATLAQGTTKIMNAAEEPEVTDLAHCLVGMGAKITGIGTDTLVVEGVPALKGYTHRILPDRIETGTYAVAAAITGGTIDLLHTSVDLLPSFIEILKKTGTRVTPIPEGIRVEGPVQLSPVDIETQPYPGFATDLQAQMTALCAFAKGTSTITETIFENRFMHVPELQRMGADMSIHGSTVTVHGVSELHGAPVMATDLRASVSLILAGLAAQGKTEVHRIYHLDRGYERLEEKLQACGARIERVREGEMPLKAVN